MREDQMHEELEQVISSMDIASFRQRWSNQKHLDPKTAYQVLWSCHIEGFKDGFNHVLSSPWLWANVSSSLQDASIVHIVRSLASDLGPSFVEQYLDQLVAHTSRTPSRSVSLYLLISACVDTIRNSDDLVRSLITHKSLESCPHISRISPRLIQLWEGNKTRKPSSAFHKEECLAHLQSTAHPVELVSLMSMEAYVHVSLDPEEKKSSHEKVFRWVQQWCHNKPSSWYDQLDEEWIKDEEKKKMVEHVFGAQKQHIDDMRLKQELQPLLSSSSSAPPPVSRKM